MREIFSSERIGLLLGPLLMLLVLLNPAPESMQQVVAEGGSVWPMQATAAVTLLIATWWISASLPLPATSLVPLVAFPVLGVMSTRDTAACYAHPLIFLFLGGFILARGVERWNLHRRIALEIILRVGTQPRTLIFGFMLATALLSMWISNTATAMMMLAIGLAVIRTIEERRGPLPGFATALLLGVGYAASLGGLATPIGTPPNVSFALLYGKQFPDQPGLNFGTWMLAFLPLTLVMLPVAWWVVTVAVCRVGPLPGDDGRAELVRQRQELGPLRGAELRMLIVFSLTALLWVTRTIPVGESNYGWSYLLQYLLRIWQVNFDPKSISDTSIAIAMALVLFILPGDPDENGKRRALMDWKTAEGLPWGVLLLFGGGYAIAEAFVRSGLSGWFAHVFTGLPLQHPLTLLGGICTLMTFLTEVTSNTATTNIMLPVIAQLSVALGVHPLPLMLAATLSASCAFMLPVATPPNAIVFGSGRIPLGTMLRAGLLLNLIGIVLISLLLYLIRDLLPQA